MNAYLVASGVDGAYVAVVRRERHVWRIMLFGVSPEQQPTEAYATRAEAGQKAVELAGVPRKP